MQQFDAKELGSKGIILDRPAYSLPPDVWTGGKNVRMRNGHVQAFPGHELVDDCDADQLTYFLLPFPTASVYMWVSAGEKLGAGYVCAFDGSSYIDATPDAGLIVSDLDRWTGGVFNGVPILANGVLNAPQYWANPTLVGTKFLPLPYDATQSWDDANLRATVIRPFKNFLVALDITEGGQRFPQLVRWSNAADPGFVPDSWDITDPTTLAGQNPLAETGGYLIDLVPMGDMAMVYKQDSVWTMSLVGGALVFKFRKALSTIGALSQNCIKEFETGSGTAMHMVVGDGDVVVHNGQTADSVVDKRVRDHLFRNMDSDYFEQTFLARNDQESEMWLCYPETGSQVCTRALVWNWLDNSWGVRDLPENTHYITTGVELPPASSGATEIWDDQAYVWNSSNLKWKERSFNPVLRSLVSASAENVFKLESGNLFDGEPAVCRAERTGIDMIGHDQFALINRVYPEMEGTGPVQIYIGAQDSPRSPVRWDGPHDFIPGVDSFINCASFGRLHGIRVESAANITWKFFGYKAEYSVMGKTYVGRS